MDCLVIFRQHEDRYMVTFPGLPITPFTALNPYAGLNEAREKLEKYEGKKNNSSSFNKLMNDLSVGDFIVEMEI